ncbi:MAG TPA: hypothetical protein VIL63_09250 [Terriglobales bacterium]
MKILRVFVVLVIVTLALGEPCLAKTKKKTKPAPHEETKIVAVTATSITVGGGANESRTYAVGLGTEVIIHGSKSTVTQLQVGMPVSVTAGTDSNKAARITTH